MTLACHPDFLYVFHADTYFKQLPAATIYFLKQAWFRTDNVLIPWGCDYQFQNAELVYRSTDWLIDTINAHPEWGVHAQYTTPREYFAKVKASAEAAKVEFPSQYIIY